METSHWFGAEFSAAWSSEGQDWLLTFCGELRLGRGMRLGGYFSSGWVMLGVISGPQSRFLLDRRDISNTRKGEGAEKVQSGRRNRRILGCSYIGKLLNYMYMYM